MHVPDTQDRSTAYTGAGEPEAPAPPTERASLWEDFIDILYTPSTVFARREHSGFWAPTLIVTALIGILFIASKGSLESMMDAEFQRGMTKAMEKNPQLTPEAAASMRGVGETMATIGIFLGTPIVILMVGFAAWAASRLFDAKQTLRASLVVAAYAYVPKVVESVIVAVQGLLLDTSNLDGRFRLSLGLGRFLDPDTTAPLTLALLGRVDLFTIWVTVLIAIGIAVTGRISRTQAALVALIVWVLGALPGVFGAVMS